MAVKLGGRGKGRGEILTLNVTSLIDVCAIIIIFLVMGTMFGESGVDPEKIKLPKSYSKEVLENAPQIIVRADVIDIRFLNRQEHSKDFVDHNEEKLKILKEQVKDYIDKSNKRVKVPDVLLNIVADKTTDYKLIYDITSFFREAGFQSMLFVAEGN